MPRSTRELATTDPMPHARRLAVPQRASRLALVAAAMLALLAVVALASRGGSAGTGDATGRGPSTAFWDYVYTGTIVLMGLGVALFVYTAVWGRAELADVRRRRGSQTIAGLVFFGLFLALAIGLRALRDDAGARSPTATRTTATEVRPATTDGRRAREPEFRWAPVVVLAVAGSATAAFFALRRRLARAGKQDGEDETLAADLAAVLDDTIDDLLAEPDPRRAVIAAYARMERSLARHGVPRDEAEAPIEYLDRASRTLHESHPAARRLLFELTHLFERAKFSADAVDPTMKEDAIETLTALRAELRGGAA